ncbi:protein kinase domain-containing protein [Haliangium sp.]|uniref:serine/threonine-protein kinase n=1 Tax=Haliangium sp. TaxID=2663208 RepID=UPI003D124910
MNRHETTEDDEAEMTRDRRDEPSPESSRSRAEGATTGLLRSRRGALPKGFEYQVVKEGIRGALFRRARAPVRIGRFRILEILGSGGMGAVYRARDEELLRDVAIKLVRSPRADDAALGARLRREAQVLAQLSHPNVVQIYDAGEHEGQVWVAMELVAGRTLRQWREQEQPGWREILARYLEAGRGLAAAHAEGLVHRDVKPDNLLLGDDGRVRVLDFGLAYAVGGAGSAAAPVDDTTPADEPRGGPASALTARMTRPDALVGTPAYMAPEQHARGTCDARTDQWSFCLALYEALYGEHPFDRGDDLGADGRHGSAGSAAGRGDEIAPAPAGTRVPSWLRAALVRGLAPDPAERWDSMDELVAELGRDRGQTRRRVAFAGLGALAAALAVALATQPGQVDEPPCAAAETALSEIWSPARRARIEAAFAATGLPMAADAWAGAEATLTRFADEWVASRVDACAATRVEGRQSEALFDLRNACLDRRAREFDTTLTVLEAPDLDVVSRAANVAAGLGEVAGCDDVQALRMGAAPPTDPATIRAVAALRDQLARAWALDDAGKYGQGHALAEAAVEQSRTLGYPPIEAEALLALGCSENALVEGTPAITALFGALDAAEASRHDEVAARAWIQLVDLAAVRTKEVDAGRRWGRRARAAVRRLAPEPAARPLLWAELEHAEGRLHTLADELPAARQALEQALSLRTEALGEDHVAVADTLVSLANEAAADGRTAEAMTLDRRAIAAFTRVLGESHPRVALAEFNLAMRQIFTGADDDAVTAGRERATRALAVYRRVYGPDSLKLAPLLMTLAFSDLRRGEHEAARAQADEAERIYRDADPAHPQRSHALDLLGLLAYREGRYSDALAAYEQSLALASGRDPHSLEAATAASNAGEATLALGRPAEALALFERALAVYELRTPQRDDLAYPLKGQGKAYLALGRPAAAIAPLERALAIRRAHPGNDPELADVTSALAQALAGAGRTPARAKRLAREAEALRSRSSSDNHASQEN